MTPSVRRFLPVSRLALAALLAAVSACAGDPGSDGSAGAPAAGSTDAPATGEEAPRSAATRIDISDLGHTVGDFNAPIRVVEFSDFGCPHCRDFHLNSYPTVHEDFVEEGLVQWKYIPYVLGTFPNSVQAARAGECAIAQRSFPAMRDRLFQEQAEWMASEDPVELFVRYAEEEGLDGEELATCIEEGARDELVQRNIDVGRQIQVRGTPTFIIDGNHVQGNRPAEFFRQVFSALLNPDSARAAQEANPPAGGGA